LGGEVTSYATLAEFRKPFPPVLPLFPKRRPQPAPKPLIKAVQYRGRLTETEIASPLTKVCDKFLRSLLHANSSCPARQLPDSLLKPQDRFRRNAPSRLLAVRKAEPEKLPVLWLSHCTLDINVGGRRLVQNDAGLRLVSFVTPRDPQAFFKSTELAVEPRDRIAKGQSMCRL